MSVNGVTTGTTTTYDAYQTTQSTVTKVEQGATESSVTETGVVYEPSNETTTETVKKTYTQNTELVAKLKAEQANRLQQLQNIVQQLLTKQGQTYNTANDIWKTLASGDFEVDAATKAQAQADIAEDGYWGVEQTSDRIIDFAIALTGGDPDKIEEMREAFKKGYKQAEETWGGELPEISKKTYDAVMEKFDKLAEEAGLTTSEATTN
ncbi:MAG: hypothetical protein J6B68_12385 [Lachnospiraceae bacterium]|nr:hypothetical protein [Lachnospiraceae bacterium]